jgi:uncharacterized protein YhjY with autotransporter beta-barrel domain
MNFNLKNLFRGAGAALAAMAAGIVTLDAQTYTLTGTSDWLGTADSNYLNGANWSTGTVPDASTDIRLLVTSANRVINLTNTTTSDMQVDVFAMRTAVNYGYTMNLASTGGAKLIYNITGRGTHPYNTDADGSSTGNTANRLNFYMNMGADTVVRFDPDGDLLAKGATSGLIYAYFKMADNAVIDATQFHNTLSVAGTSATTPGLVTFSGEVAIGGMDIGPNAKVLLGTNRANLGAGILAGMEEKWEGLLLQEEWTVADNFNLAQVGSGTSAGILPEGVTAEMLSRNEGMQDTQKWGVGVTRVTTTGTVIHPGRFNIRANAGTVNGYAVDGKHYGPIIVTNANNWLGGTGLVTGNVTVNNNAFITGGDRRTAGTLTVTGTVNLNGTLSIDLVDWSHVDKVVVNGDMVIGATGNFAAGWTTDSVPVQSGTFRVVEVTGGGITGSFDSAALPQKLRLESTYLQGSNYVDLIFTGYEGFAQHPGITGNQEAVAAILDRIHANPAGKSVEVVAAVESLYTMLDSLPLVYARQALTQLSPSTYQAWYPSAVLRANSMVQSIEDRLMQDAGYGRARRSTQTYVQGWRQESSRNPDAFAAYSNYGTDAILAGVDYAFTENTVAGIYLAYETTEYDLDTDGGTSKGEGYTAGAYVRHNIGDWQFNAVGLFGTDDYTANSSIVLTGLGHNWAGADTDGTRYGAAASVAYTFKLSWLDAAPVLGVQWLSWKADGFTGTGADSANLVVKSQSATSLQARLGVRLSRAFETNRGFMRPYLHMAYVHEFENGERDINSDLFGESLTTKSPGIEANGMRVDAGIDWDVTKAIRAGVRYTAQYNNACDESMGVRASISFAF